MTALQMKQGSLAGGILRRRLKARACSDAFTRAFEDFDADGERKGSEGG